MKPHKHAELIKAWADGAEIEGFSELDQKWKLFIGAPDWHDERKYRIKPELKQDVVFLTFFSPFVPVYTWGIQEPNIRVVFDAKTRKPKSAEVLK